ncbi:MAG: hypothetical protein IH892_19975, partial [Planctomycetes bacterium]|nr:hypothetical protein [Planctomycetota bacterium]
MNDLHNRRQISFLKMASVLILSLLLFEIHVACMARWPGRLHVGRVDDRHTLTFDLTASILSATECTLPDERP